MQAPATGSPLQGCASTAATVGVPQGNHAEAAESDDYRAFLSEMRTAKSQRERRIVGGPGAAKAALVVQPSLLKRKDTLLLLDLDDTLVPSSSVLVPLSNMNGDAGSVTGAAKEQLITSLRPIDAEAAMFVEDASKTCDILLLTNATMGWVENVAGKFSPRVLTALLQKGGAIWSARELAQDEDEIINYKESLQWKWRALSYVDQLSAYKRVVVVGDGEPEMIAAAHMHQRQLGPTVHTVRFLLHPEANKLESQLKELRKEWSSGRFSLDEHSHSFFKPHPTQLVALHRGDPCQLSVTGTATAKKKRKESYKPKELRPSGTDTPTTGAYWVVIGALAAIESDLRPRGTDSSYSAQKVPCPILTVAYSERRFPPFPFRLRATHWLHR